MKILIMNTKYPRAIHYTETQFAHVCKRANEVGKTLVIYSERETHTRSSLGFSVLPRDTAVKRPLTLPPYPQPL